MNFFGVGPAELIVILVVALVFVGPERLPRLAADLARTIREIRKYTGSLAAEFNEVIQDFERETETDRGQWREIGEGLTGATKSVTDAIRGARADAEIGDAASPAVGSGAGAAAASDGGQPAEPQWREIPEPGASAVGGPNGAVATNGAQAERASETPASDSTVGITSSGTDAPNPPSETDLIEHEAHTASDGGGAR